MAYHYENIRLERGCTPQRPHFSQTLEELGPQRAVTGARPLEGMDALPASAQAL